MQINDQSVTSLVNQCGALTHAKLKCKIKHLTIASDFGDNEVTCKNLIYHNLKQTVKLATVATCI